MAISQDMTNDQSQLTSQTFKTINDSTKKLPARHIRARSGLQYKPGKKLATIAHHVRSPPSRQYNSNVAYSLGEAHLDTAVNALQPRISASLARNLKTKSNFSHKSQKSKWIAKDEFQKWQAIVGSEQNKPNMFSETVDTDYIG